MCGHYLSPRSLRVNEQILKLLKICSSMCVAWEIIKKLPEISWFGSEVLFWQFFLWFLMLQTCQSKYFNKVILLIYWIYFWTSNFLPWKGRLEISNGHSTPKWAPKILKFWWRPFYIQPFSFQPNELISRSKNYFRNTLMHMDVFSTKAKFSCPPTINIMRLSVMVKNISSLG